MTAQLRTSTARAYLHTPTVVRFAGRSIALSMVVLAAGLLIGGCDGGSPSAPSAFAAGVPNATKSASAELSGSVGDTAAVIAVSQAWDAAWNAGNPDGIAALFVEDAEFINGRGQIAVGSATIRANHAASLAGPFLGSRSSGHIRRVTFLNGSTAVLDVDNEVTGFRSLPGGAIPTQPGLNLQRHKRVLVKRSGHWRTLQMQLTTVAPAAP